MKVLKFRMFWWKKGNNSIKSNGIYFKIAGWVDLDMLHILQFKLNLYLLWFLKYKTKSINLLQIWWKKGNNSKMGIQIYFKIAG
jgi:hypothetical protein